MEHLLGDIFHHAVQSDVRHVQIDGPLILQADLEVERAVADHIAGQHADLDAVHPIDLDGLVRGEGGGHDLVKVIQRAHIIGAELIVAFGVAAQAPVEHPGFLPGDRGDPDDVAVLIACQALHQGHALRHIQRDLVIREDEILRRVVRDIELDVEEFLQIGHLCGNIQDRDDIRRARAAGDDGRRQLSCLAAGVPDRADRIAAGIGDAVGQDLRVVPLVADGQRTAAVDDAHLHLIDILVRRVVDVDPGGDDLVEIHAGDLEFTGDEVLLHEDQRNCSGRVFKDRHGFLGGQMARIHVGGDLVFAAGQLHRRNASAVGGERALGARAPVDQHLDVRKRIVVFVDDLHIQGPELGALAHLHAPGPGRADPVVVRQRQCDLIGPCRGVFLHRPRLLRGRAVAEIPQPAFDRAVIRTAGGVEILLHANLQIGGYVHGNDRGFIDALVDIGDVLRIAPGVAQPVHRAHLVDKVMRCVRGDLVDERIVGARAGGSGAEAPEAASVRRTVDPVAAGIGLAEARPGQRHCVALQGRGKVPDLRGLQIHRIARRQILRTQTRGVHRVGAQRDHIAVAELLHGDLHGQQLAVVVDPIRFAEDSVLRILIDLVFHRHGAQAAVVRRKHGNGGVGGADAAVIGLAEAVDDWLLRIRGGLRADGLRQAALVGAGIRHADPVEVCLVCFDVPVVIIDRGQAGGELRVAAVRLLRAVNRVAQAVLIPLGPGDGDIAAASLGADAGGGVRGRAVDEVAIVRGAAILRAGVPAAVLCHGAQIKVALRIIVRIHLAAPGAAGLRLAVGLRVQRRPGFQVRRSLDPELGHAALILRRCRKV